MGISRYVNASVFYDQPLTDIYEYQKLCPFCIFGDFNSRISDLPDSIEGVDILPERHVIDFTKKYTW